MGGDLLNIGILSRRSEGKKAVARYRPRVPPSLGAALRLALRAAWREGWLVPVGAALAAVGVPRLERRPRGARRAARAALRSRRAGPRGARRAGVAAGRRALR